MGCVVRSAKCVGNGYGGGAGLKSSATVPVVIILTVVGYGGMFLSTLSTTSDPHYAHRTPHYRRPIPSSSLLTKDRPPFELISSDPCINLIINNLVGEWNYQGVFIFSITLENVSFFNGQGHDGLDI